MKKELLLALNQLDLFKKPLYLRVEQREMNGTSFGIMLSLVIYALLVYSFLHSNFFMKTRPKIITQTAHLDIAPAIVYKDRPFAFGLQSIDGKLIRDPGVFYFSVFIGKRALNGAIFDMENKGFHECNSSDFERYGDKSHLQGLLCLDDPSFQVFGKEGDEKLSVFELHLILCQNSTVNNNSCRSKDDFSAFFQLNNLKIVYMNTIYKLEDYSEPISKEFTVSLYKIETQIRRLVIYYFQPATLITDSAVLFPLETIESTWFIESFKEELSFVDDVGNNLPVISLLIYSSVALRVDKRSYQSLPECIAVLGGLFNFFLLCGKVLSRIDKAVFLTTLLMNHLYSFQQQANHLLNRNSKVQIRKWIKNQKVEFSKKLSKTTNETLKKYCKPVKIHKRMGFSPTESKIKSFEAFVSFNDRKNKMHFNIWEFIRLMLKRVFRRKRNFKERLFLKAQEVFDSEIDLVNILQRIQDIEKIKYLFLSQKQISLFNVLEKPMIYLDEKNHSKTLRAKMDQAFEYYQELESRDVLDPVDQKLYDLVESRFSIYKKYFLSQSKAKEKNKKSKD